jgi:hypothetical protein
MIPFTLEFLKMNTLWQVQQSVHDMSHPLNQVKRKGSGQWGRGQRLKGVLMVVVVHPTTCYCQILEEGEGTDHFEYF